MESGCNICKSRKITSVGYCVECKQAICEQCQTFHSQFNATANHKLLTSVRDTCIIHKQTIEYISKRDKAVYCRECTSVYGCSSDLVSLSEFLNNENVILEKLTVGSKCLHKQIEDTKKSSQQVVRHAVDLETIITELETVKEATVKLVELLSIKLRRYKNQSSELLKRMGKYSASDTQIAQLDNLFKMIVEFPFNVERASLLIDMEKLIERNDQEVHMATSDTLPTFNSEENDLDGECGIRVAFHTLMTLCHSVDSRYTALQTKNYVNTLSEGHKLVAEQGNEAKGDVCRESNSSLTEQKIVYNQKSDEVTRRKRVPSETLEHYKSLIDEKESDTATSLTSRSHFDMQVLTENDDEKCAITGLVELPDGFIAMADFKNKILKLFSTDYQILDTKSFTENPRDISLFDSDVFVVTIPLQKRIQLVKVVQMEGETKMQLGISIDVDSLCCGISVVDKVIYTATQFPARVLILKGNGDPFDEVLGDGKFARPTYTLYDKTLSRIYISDATHKCIFGLDANKTIVFRYFVGHPHGIALDETGNVFVADWDSSSVHKVSNDGTLLAQLKLEPSDCPQKLFYNIDKRCLFVTLWESNVLRVFYL